MHFCIFLKGVFVTAERRMFAKTIIDSDAFLDMPISARLLYYDLGMRADDDGFINAPRKIMKMIGATNDDMNILIARKFVIPFESGVVVIKAWRINNYLRSDRYNETKYLEEKAQLVLDQNGMYHSKKGDEVEGGIPGGIPMVSTGKDSIGKVSIGNSNTDHPKEKKKHKYGEYQHVLLTDDEYKKLAEDFTERKRDKAIKFLDEYIEEKGYKSKSHNLAIRRWVMKAVEERKNNGRVETDNESTLDYSQIVSITDFG